MKDSLMTDPGRSYVMGVITMSLAMFFGYLWSPDYLEFVSNGYNFLIITGFGSAVFIATWLIDGYYKTKRTHNIPKEKVE